MSRVSITDFLLERIAEDEAGLDATPSSCKHEDDFGFGGTDDYQQFTIGYGRAVAECAAKRELVDAWHDEHGGGHVLRTLASVYSDHPDYQQKWAV